jgi:hypothetical protein
MAFQIQTVDYFHASVKDQPGSAHDLLSCLADVGVNLMAFSAVPTGPTQTQLTLFPQDAARLREAAQKADVALTGPYPALLVQGDDELGALAAVHRELYDAGVNVFASSGVADGAGSYGYVVYVRQDEFARAASAMGLS